MEDDFSTIPTFDAIRALAFVGDLSMGQPTDHSVRTAWLASRLAAAAGLPPPDVDVAQEAALLRWSGCTANAGGFADILGDDVAGREAMLAMRPDWAASLDSVGGVQQAILPLAQAHCEVSGELARMLGLSRETQATLRHIFECFDGNGMPDGLTGSQVPLTVFVVNLAGDLEIFSRTYGLEGACALIARKAGAQYPQELAALATRLAGDLLRALERETDAAVQANLLTDGMAQMTVPELIADVADLKLPWLTGFSRRVAHAAARCCASLGMDELTQGQVYRAGLIHGLGRAAVPNTIWAAPPPLAESAWEKIRLVPYWTARAGKQIASLSTEAEIASYGYERLDGSGYFRGVGGNAVPLKGQVLGISIIWEALRSTRPWRNAMTVAEASAHLRGEAERGRLDREIVERMIAPAPQGDGARKKSTDHALSPREAEVLRHISLGSSNKAAARALGLSPSTVATHLESVFRKLGCSTRAAATLKASTLGLL